MYRGLSDDHRLSSGLRGNSCGYAKRNLPEKFPCQDAKDRRDDCAQAKSNDWKQNHDAGYCKYYPRAYGDSRMRLFGSRASVDLPVAPPGSRPLPRWWDPDSHVGIEACRRLSSRCRLNHLDPTLEALHQSGIEAGIKNFFWTVWFCSHDRAFDCLDEQPLIDGGQSNEKEVRSTTLTALSPIWRSKEPR